MFEHIGGEEVFAGNLISIRRERYRHEDGEEVERELAVHPGAAVVVPFDGTHVHLVVQPREVVGEAALVELPAGKLDSGEAPEETAQRELIEEIGMRAATLEPIATVYASPGFSDERFHLFLGTDLSSASAESDEDERIELRSVPVDGLDALIDEVRDAKTLIGLLHLRRRLDP